MDSLIIKIFLKSGTSGGTKDLSILESGSTTFKFSRNVALFPRTERAHVFILVAFYAILLFIIEIVE